MMNRTQNYNLCQWEAADKIQRTDFNADNAKIDAALGDKLRLVTGRYQGTGTYGPEHPTVIEVPGAERPPRLIIVSEENDYRHAILFRGVTEAVVYETAGAYPVHATWTDEGVKFYSDEASFKQLNYDRTDEDYFYRYAVFI